MRFIMTGILLCVLASAAVAGEHYIEIWNPPEARTPGAPGTHAPAPAPGKKAHPHHGAKRKLASGEHVAPRKVTEPAFREPAPGVPAAPGNAAPDRERTPVIAPQIGPDGNVLQVSYGVGAAR